MHLKKQYFIFLLLFSNSIYAKETSFELGEIIVSGNQSRIVEQVGTVDIITAEDISLSGARNLNEAIDLLPGIYVRTGGDGTPRIDIRGLRTRQVILLLDGVPVNSSIDGQFDPSAIDVTNIDRVKVTRGAGSLLYGTGGNAGVINIITKAGSGNLKSHVKAELGNNGTKLGQVSASGGGKNWQGFVSGTHYHRNSFRLSNDYIPVNVSGNPNPNNFQASGDRINSDRDDTNLYANLIWQAFEKTEFGLSSSYRTGNYGKPSETRDFTGGDADPFAKRPKYERVDNYESYSFNLTGTHELAIPLLIKPALYFNHLNELTNNYDNANFNTQIARRATNTDATSDIYGASLLLSYDFSRFGKSSISGDCRQEKWQADGFEILAGNVFSSVSINEHDTICSVAFEHETIVFDNLGLVGGIGTAHQRKKSGSSDSGDTYIIGATYDFPTDTQLHLSHTKKIRFPTLRDLFEPGRANPNLVKETTFHYEAGIEQTLSFIPVSFGVTVFRIDAEDFIETVNSVAQNIESDRFQGIEVTSNIKPIKNLSLRANYTFMESENRSPNTVNRDLQQRPKHRLNLDIAYKIPYIDADLYASWSHVEDALEQDRATGLISQEIDEFDIVDLRIEKEVVNYLSVFGRAMNLLDESYAESGGFPSPGRTVLFGIEMNYGS
ncbi:MAG: TonB-dependent receptor [Proteobacteria bacterium]|nr:TonB-dependent receptor [Pseudomonadota bacterium]NOG61581.1 TonB-dependent receptor [Pseudomonadota bacterium]